MPPTGPVAASASLGAPGLWGVRLQGPLAPLCVPGARQGWAACRSRWGPVQLGGGRLLLEPVPDVENSKCLQRATPSWSSGRAVPWPPLPGRVPGSRPALWCPPLGSPVRCAGSCAPVGLLRPALPVTQPELLALLLPCVRPLSAMSRVCTLLSSSSGPPDPTVHLVPRLRHWLGLDTHPDKATTRLASHEGPAPPEGPAGRVLS